MGPETGGYRLTTVVMLFLVGWAFINIRWCNTCDIFCLFYEISPSTPRAGLMGIPRSASEWTPSASNSCLLLHPAQTRSMYCTATSSTRVKFTRFSIGLTRQRSIHAHTDDISDWFCVKMQTFVISHHPRIHGTHSSNKTYDPYSLWSTASVHAYRHRPYSCFRGGSMLQVATP